MWQKRKLHDYWYRYLTFHNEDFNSRPKCTGTFEQPSSVSDSCSLLPEYVSCCSWVWSWYRPVAVPWATAVLFYLNMFIAVPQCRVDIVQSLFREQQLFLLTWICFSLFLRVELIPYHLDVVPWATAILFYLNMFLAVPECRVDIVQSLFREQQLFLLSRQLLGCGQPNLGF